MTHVATVYAVFIWSAAIQTKHSININIVIYVDSITNLMILFAYFNLYWSKRNIRFFSIFLYNFFFLSTSAAHVRDNICLVENSCIILQHIFSNIQIILKFLILLLFFHSYKWRTVQPKPKQTPQILDTKSYSKGAPCIRRQLQRIPSAAPTVHFIPPITCAG